MNSLNHYSYGAVTEFLYRDVAGIQSQDIGFKRVRFEPQPDIRIGQLTCSFDSVYGKYVSEWEICEDKTIAFHFEVPFGCEADICLPEQEPIHVLAGNYDYRIQTQRDYHKIYSINTAYRDLLKNPKAVAVIERSIPDFFKILDQNDEEAMGNSFANKISEAELFRQPTDILKKVVSDISELPYSL